MKKYILKCTSTYQPYPTPSDEEWVTEELIGGVQDLIEKDELYPDKGKYITARSSKIICVETPFGPRNCFLSLGAVFYNYCKHAVIGRYDYYWISLQVSATFKVERYDGTHKYQYGNIICHTLFTEDPNWEEYCDVLTWLNNLGGTKTLQVKLYGNYHATE
jgi:hypothetical protein